MRTIGKALTVGMLAATMTLAGVSSANAAPTYFSGDNCGISQSSYYAGASCAANRRCSDRLLALLFLPANHLPRKREVRQRSP